MSQWLLGTRGVVHVTGALLVTRGVVHVTGRLAHGG